MAEEKANGYRDDLSMPGLTWYCASDQGRAVYKIPVCVQTSTHEHLVLVGGASNRLFPFPEQPWKKSWHPELAATSLFEKSSAMGLLPQLCSFCHSSA